MSKGPERCGGRKEGYCRRRRKEAEEGQRGRIKRSI